MRKALSAFFAVVAVAAMLAAALPGSAAAGPSSGVRLDNVGGGPVATL